MSTEGRELIKTADVVTGIHANGPDGEVTINAPLVVAADGRTSVLRHQAGLEVSVLGAPIDVLLVWRSDEAIRTLSRRLAGSMPEAFRPNHHRSRRVLAMRLRHSQRRSRCVEGWVAGGLQTERRRCRPLSWGSHRRRRELGRREIVERCRRPARRRWSASGLLCIGDAAHAMSPIGGVGINMAIQDAVATSNLLADKIKAGPIATADLDVCTPAAFKLPTRITQEFPDICAKSRAAADACRGYFEGAARCEIARSLACAAGVARPFYWLRRAPRACEAPIVRQGLVKLVYCSRQNFCGNKRVVLGCGVTGICVATC